jgi:hypothetical protein
VNRRTAELGAPKMDGGSVLSIKQAGHNNEVEVEVSAEPPLIYLDHWALRLLSDNPTLTGRFLVAFERRGTVMFSLMNVREIANDSNHTKGIRDFLDALGPHWVPVTIDPFRIIDAEETGHKPDRMDPCVSVGFLTDPRFAALLMTGAVSLAHVVDLTAGPEGGPLIAADDLTTCKLLQEIQRARDLYATDPQSLSRMFPIMEFDAKKPMRSIYNGLMHYLVKDSFSLNGNHARDLYHAIVPLCCANMVTLDKHWVGQVRKLRLPPTFVKVYSRPEFKAFLSDLEAEPASR